jgi:hypothetical protein
MGRYYNGDIDGKFWFGVQSSVAAERFGTSAIEPNYVEFSFDEDNLGSIEKELEAIEDKLGYKLSKLKEFFSDGGAGYRGYNDEMIKAINITSEDLSEYADYLLGIKIRDCVMRQGECNFQAEL